MHSLLHTQLTSFSLWFLCVPGEGCTSLSIPLQDDIWDISNMELFVRKLAREISARVKHIFINTKKHGPDWMAIV